MYDGQYTEDFRDVLKSRSISKLAETSSIALGCPVIVLDASFHILARGLGRMPEDVRQSLPVQQRYTPIQTFSNADPDYPAQGCVSYFLTEDSYGRSSRWARYAMTIGYRTVGYLCAVLGKNKPTDEMADLLEWISRFALILLVSEQPSGVFGSREQFFFTTLINSPNENSNETLLTEQCRKLGISMDETKYLLTTHLQPQNCAYPIALESLLEEFHSAIPGSYTYLYKENITAVFSMEEASVNICSVLTALLPVLAKSGLVCGVSSDFASLTGLGRAYTQAITAMNLGNRLSPGALMFAYDDYSYYDMMSICEGSRELLSFCHPSIRCLLQYDSRHGSSHLSTLYAYLVNGCSITKAAEELDVHRNTVKYRITQISQIIGVEVGDGLDSFHFLRSLDILKYLGRL